MNLGILQKYGIVLIGTVIIVDNTIGAMVLVAGTIGQTKVRTMMYNVPLGKGNM